MLPIHPVQYLLVGLALALHLAGIKLGAVFAAGAVFAVGFGFAMQNIAQNFVSGRKDAEVFDLHARRASRQRHLRGAR